LLEIISNKLEENLISSNGHDLRIIELLKSGDCRLVSPKDCLSEHSTVLDIPGLGLRDYIKICISGKKIFRNIFIQDSFYCYQLSKLKFFLKTKQIGKISLTDFLNLIRALLREIFFYLVARNFGFVSFDDALAFKNVIIIPNGVNKSDVTPDSVPTDNREFIFWGNLNYPPNLESILYLLEKQWKGISASLESCCLELHGVISSSSRDAIKKVIFEMNFDNVFIRGPFDNLTDITRGKIFLNCIQFGSGVKNKTLEAGALGVAQICTKSAISGIENANDFVSFDYFIEDPQEALKMLHTDVDFLLYSITWTESSNLYKKKMIRGYN
jgi:hypothetical protein